jgi:hypothetical protein
LPIGAEVQFFQEDACAVADVAEIGEAAVDESYVSQFFVFEEFFLSGGVVVFVFAVLVLGLVLEVFVFLFVGVVSFQSDLLVGRTVAKWGGSYSRWLSMVGA